MWIFQNIFGNYMIRYWSKYIHWNCWCFCRSCHFWTGYCNTCSCQETRQGIQGALRFFSCQYLLISVYMCQYQCIYVHIQQLIKWATERRVHSFSRLCLYWITYCKGPMACSRMSDIMVCRPDHGPQVDVKEAAAWSWLAIFVADAMLISCCLPVPHGVGDCPSVSV